ncbi:15242_t:CDS:2 [Dentiscutata erythropus]|uniref:15242_t:CDS:1 n=1 Tax=Dentiscutata erythropus TaxID=1348616 RepID=A0A9N9CWG0_9GLOM|nr:15242_t:CDS:2 [Dentiscutata erythropus]
MVQEKNLNISTKIMQHETLDFMSEKNLNIFYKDNATRNKQKAKVCDTSTGRILSNIYLEASSNSSCIYNMTIAS